MRMVNSRDKLNNPVIIGGVGGSGTRVVQEILEQAGFYMGQDLNPEKDNLWFTALFKRPEWFMKNENNIKINSIIDAFVKSMFGHSKFDINSRIIFGEIIIKNLLGKYKVAGVENREWIKKRIYNMIHSKKIDISSYNGWGWKEPNTHIFIKYLAGYFDNLKYIHVIRNGLDMAYSDNQNQLKNWGEMFEVKFPEKQKDVPKALLEYWIKANNKAIGEAQNILKDNFYVIRFDELCINPKKEIDGLLDFLNIDKKDIDLYKLYSLPRIPKSFERYKSYNLSIFSDEQINAVKELGFKLK